MPSLERARARALFMVTVWERMGEMFGQLWENSFGTAEEGGIETWTRGLAHCSEDAILWALDQLKGWAKPFPPTLGEFGELCRQYRPPAVAPDNQLTHSPRISREQRAR